MVSLLHPQYKQTDMMDLGWIIATYVADAAKQTAATGIDTDT